MELNSVDGSGPNTATGKVDWSQLQNVPPGFADNTDDGGGGGGADADAIHDNVSGRDKCAHRQGDAGRRGPRC